jgi:glyoxylase-like metal-dependent hydrolase (beta-lactamase superfamily II)
MYQQPEIDYLVKFMTDKGLTPQAIINTHAHIDHIFGVQAMKDKYNVPFYIHQKDLPVLQNAMMSANMFGLDFKAAPQADGYIDENKPLQLGTDNVEVRFAPGHSPGSVVFYYAGGNWLIGGDVLFNGSIGRTDLPGGNHDTLINSIKTQLYTLPDNTTVYSGHGAATTIGNEKKSNPFVRG